MEQLYIKEPTMYKGVFSWSDAVLAVNKYQACQLKL
jgi:hypothetical protein